MLEMRDYRFKIEYKVGKKNVVANQFSRPVRLVKGDDNGSWLGKSKEEIKEMQSASHDGGDGKLFGMRKDT